MEAGQNSLAGSSEQNQLATSENAIGPTSSWLILKGGFRSFSHGLYSLESEAKKEVERLEASRLANNAKVQQWKNDIKLGVKKFQRGDGFLYRHEDEKWTYKSVR